MKNQKTCIMKRHQVSFWALYTCLIFQVLSSFFILWPSSGLVCQQNPCSGCTSQINLAVVLEYTFFQICINAEQIFLVEKIDEMNGLNERRKEASVSTFDFSTVYTKLLHDKLLMVLNSLIDFCFDGEESKNITVNNYGARWVKNIQDNEICLNKQQIKDAVAYLLFNCDFTVTPKIFCQIIGIPVGSDPVLFFANLFLHLSESKWMNELKKNDLIKARNLCNVFRFSDDLNSINDGAKFESNCSNNYHEELLLDKENTDKHEASFLDLNIKIKDEKFHFDLFDKRNYFLFLLSECQASQVVYHLVQFILSLVLNR